EHADILWGTQWRYLGDHVPDGIEQTIVRVPRFRIRAESKSGRSGGETFCGWTWICPACEVKARVLLYPLDPQYGVNLLAQDFPHLTGAPLPAPIKRFACARCVKVLNFTRFDSNSWNKLVSHLTGGLLYGHDV